MSITLDEIEEKLNALYSQISTTPFEIREGSDREHIVIEGTQQREWFVGQVIKFEQTHANSNLRRRITDHVCDPAGFDGAGKITLTVNKLPEMPTVRIYAPDPEDGYVEGSKFQFVGGE